MTTIRITIEVEGDATVSVSQDETPAAAASRVFADELEPLPPEPNAPVFRTISAPQSNPGECPVHHVPWKVVPAGVSKSTGRPYESFTACPERGCKERPR